MLKVFEIYNLQPRKINGLQLTIDAWKRETAIGNHHFNSCLGSLFVLGGVEFAETASFKCLLALPTKFDKSCFGKLEQDSDSDPLLLEAFRSQTCPISSQLMAEINADFS